MVLFIWFIYFYGILWTHLGQMKLAYLEKAIMITRITLASPAHACSALVFTYYSVMDNF